MGDLGEKRIAVFEMTIGRRRAHPGQTRGLGQAKAERAVLLDELARGLQQRLFEVAVMIGTGAPPTAA